MRSRAALLVLALPAACAFSRGRPAAPARPPFAGRAGPLFSEAYFDGLDSDEMPWRRTSQEVKAAISRRRPLGKPYLEPVFALQEKLAKDDRLRVSLELALCKAKVEADNRLKPALLKALPWPTTVREYLDYLADFATWVPTQSGDAAWASGASGTEHQEVYDRLCHWHFLVAGVQDDAWFGGEWMPSFSRAWGEFLNDPGSFDESVWRTFLEHSPRYEVESSLVEDAASGDLVPNSPSGWRTFNQFFARRLNPGLRPIARPSSNALPTSPADCTFRAEYRIARNGSIPAITVKGTHTFASVGELLTNQSALAERFHGGRFAHYFLGPYSYHHFHLPVSGTVVECFPVQGRSFLGVGIGAAGGFEAPDDATDGFEFLQARGVVVIDTAGSPCGDVGLVAVVPVGMTHVSSVNMLHAVGAHGAKGDEFGYFLFGGSDVVVLFERKAAARIDTDGAVYRRVGEPIAALRARGVRAGGGGGRGGRRIWGALRGLQGWRRIWDF